jgi:hypothetical protein
LNATLLEALVAQIEANETIIGLFPGGCYNSTAAPGTETPNLNLKQTDSQPTGIIGKKWWIDKVTIAFEVRDTTGDSAEILADQLRTAIMQCTPVGWTNGQENGRFLMEGAAGELEDGLGVDGSDNWVQRLPIGFNITRTA